MGLFGSRPTAEIHLDPIHKPFYSPGETITGTVVLENKKQISIGFIDLKCVGELFYQRTEHTGGPNGHTQVIDEHLPFFIAHKDLVSSRVSRLVNNERTELNPGVYQWPFSFRLPKDLPPTLEVAAERKPPYIQYLLKVTYVGRWVIPKVIAQYPIMVIPRVGLSPYLLPIEIDDTNRKDVYVHVKMKKNYLLVGKRDIPLEVVIQNPNQSIIKEVIISLKQRRHLGIAGTRETTLYTTSLPGIVDFQGQHLHNTFPLPILCSWAELVPTYVYRTPVDMKSPWTIDYTFEITFKIGGLLTNIIFKLPIAVINAER